MTLDMKALIEFFGNYKGHMPEGLRVMVLHGNFINNKSLETGLMTVREIMESSRDIAGKLNPSADGDSIPVLRSPAGIHIYSPSTGEYLGSFRRSS